MQKETEPVRYRASAYHGGLLTTSRQVAECDAREFAARLHEQWAVWKLVGLINPNGSVVEVKGEEDVRRLVSVDAKLHN